jgi:hypothetical protein
MSSFVFLSLLLLFLPLFNAEPVHNEFENNDDLLMQRSVAANYLCKYFCIEIQSLFFLFLLFF